MALNNQYLINDVEALWPRINKTYKFDNAENRTVPCDAFDEGAKYETRFRMTKDQAKALFVAMVTAYEAKKEKGWPDKFEMPFAMAWPELYRQVVLASTRQELQLMHLLHINNEDHRSPQSDQTSADYCAQVDKARVEAQNIRTDFDESTDEPEQLWEPHEAAIFGLAQVNFKSKATFTESQYLLCPDFGQIYERLQENDRVEKGRRRKKAHDLRMLARDSILCPVLTRSQKQMLHEQQQDDDGVKESKVQHKSDRLVKGSLDNAADDDDTASVADKSEDKNKKSADRKKKLSSKMIDAVIHRYHIEGGFLYFNSPTDGMVVCVPQGKAFDSDIRDYSDLTDEAAQHEKEHFTLRQTIIDELHLTPMQGHRGYNATAAAVRRRYYWPTLSADVRTRIDGCTKCNMSKINRSKPQGKMIPVQLPDEPGQSFNLDLIVDLPEVQLNGILYNRILVAVDRYSKRVYLNKITRAHLSRCMFMAGSIGAGIKQILRAPRPFYIRPDLLKPRYESWGYSSPCK